MPSSPAINMRSLLIGGFEAAVDSARPANCLPAHIPAPPTGKTYVIGAGKAAAEMARVFEDHYQGGYEGLVITRYGHGVPTKKIRVIEAAHPVPDESGPKAAREIINLVSKAGKDDLVICLLSGGGSALLSLPADTIAFATYQDINKQLLKSGAPIGHINAIRKHLTQAFGGRLMKAAFPAKLITLSISDVAGDDPSVIASGPTVGDPTTQDQVLGFLKDYGIAADEAVTAHLNDRANETPKPDDPIFKSSEYILIATPQQALEAGAEYFNQHGITPHILSSNLEGDTNYTAIAHCERILNNTDTRRPFALLSGGETTVKVMGNGDGGPNTQFMLQSALALNGAANIHALACDTDGIDGSMDNAGALIDPTTLERANKKGLNAQALLDNNDSYNFFKPLGDLVIPGPTHTNVNDFRVFIAGE